MAEFFQDLRPGGAGADAAALDLGPQLLILNQLSRILHCQDHGTGCVSFGRRSLALFDGKTGNIQNISLFHGL